MASPESEPELLLDLRVPATSDGMNAVHAALAGCWVTLQPMCALEPIWCDQFSLAVAEVSANIIQHAHAPEPPLVQFALSLTRYPDRLTARFVDAGILATPPESPIMPSVNVAYDELGERGRGLALVQATTDRFSYQRTPAGENVWTIEKDFPPPATG